MAIPLFHIYVVLFVLFVVNILFYFPHFAHISLLLFIYNLCLEIYIPIFALIIDFHTHSLVI